ncbi:adenylyltransferase/cytidyltransferase family protein [Carboxylicivirga marina]|uniref:Adenylyltransferase/cytidyltransferase family protein n=1 Tax=Carboxylicivirga marina TaxID=2800988 RepID=A0ABS1HP92_9BACT|nr:adenylyltransferase/cytidyltransferase family protein [Carboxylicivirga marina]MBK3519497.1 adenylyltransferase/cytidyltransferase family protein [Carboxylicivirga marina]
MIKGKNNRDKGLTEFSVDGQNSTMHIDLIGEMVEQYVNEYTEKGNSKERYIQVNSNKNSLKFKVKQKAKYNRVYTSGCFDLFHYGHLNILKESKALCNHLVVGVSTDELIEKEKGKRPSIPFEERIRIVKAIKYVDEVIPQVDKNKQKIVDMFDIEAITVGDDWRGKFPKVSCAVEYFPYTPHVSSTILKEKLGL